MPDAAIPAGCRCPECVAACRRKPGCLLPGQEEEIAAFLGITVQQLFAERLCVEYWHAENPDEETLFFLQPIVESMKSGREAGFSDAAQRGSPCTFLTEDDRCSIHPVKPYECRESMLCQPNNGRGAEINRALRDGWMTQQHRIARLLGRAPAAPEPTVVDGLNVLGALVDQALGRCKR